MIVSQEVPLYFYSLDLVVTFREKDLDVVIEVENKSTKWFRAQRIGPEKTLRKMLIINSPHAYKYIEIDTQEYDRYEKVSD